MASLDTNTIRKNFCRKGFKESCSKHIHLNYYYNGKKTAIYTVISHGAKNIGDPLITSMARQIKLSKKDFIHFAECSLSEEMYFEKIKNEM